MSFRVVAASGGIRRGCVRASGAVACVHPSPVPACIRRRCLRASGDYPSAGSGRGTPGRRVRGCPRGSIVGYSSSRWTRFRRHRIGFPPIPRCQGGTCSPQPVPPLLFPGVRLERRLLVGLRRVPRSAQGRRSRGQTGPCSCMHSACSCVAGATHSAAVGSGGGGSPRVRRCRIIDRGTAFRFGGQTGPLVGHPDVVHRSGDRLSGAVARSLPSAACPCTVLLYFPARRRRCPPRRRLTPRRLLRRHRLCPRHRRGRSLRPPPSCPEPRSRLVAGPPWSSSSRNSQPW